ncbi:MAG: DUF4249 domain-containing protein [Bacteroidales bacterium]|nr:DUF4249 domain-containing protein [Bacteroidales bacterium]
MKNRILILSATIALLASACDDLETPIGFNGDVSKQQAVMQSKIETDENLSVRMSYSRFFLDTSPFKIEKNATFSLKVNGTLLSSDQGEYDDDDLCYYFDYIPQAGDAIEITANIPGHDPVSAKTVVPTKPNITSADLSMGNFDNEYSVQQFTCNIRLNDPANEENYYRIDFWATIDEIRTETEITERTVPDTIFQDGTFHIGQRTVYDTTITRDTSLYNMWPDVTCNDYLITDGTSSMLSLIDELDGNELFFDDNKFNGQSHDIPFLLSLDDYYINYNYQYYDYYGKKTIRTQHIPSTLKIYMAIYSYSRDLYLYELSVASLENELGSIFSEPAQFHSNIEGGIGIFAAKSSTTKTFTPLAISPTTNE